MSHRNPDAEPVERTQEYAEYRESDTQAHDDQTPREWFESIIQGRILPCVDLGDAELVLTRSDHSIPPRYRLRMQHSEDLGQPHVDISPALDAGEFESWLRGYAAALGDEIETQAEMIDHPDDRPHHDHNADE